MAIQARPQDERVRELSPWKRFLGRPELGAVAGAILVFIFFAVVAGDSGFLNFRGVVSWLEVSAQLGILAVAAALLMIGGEFDLSIGSTVGAAGGMEVMAEVMAMILDRVRRVARSGHALARAGIEGVQPIGRGADVHGVARARGRVGLVDAHEPVPHPR